MEIFWRGLASDTSLVAILSALWKTETETPQGATRRGFFADRGEMEGRMTTEERFWSRVQVVGDCWISTFSDMGKGYAQFGTGGKKFLAHRFSWQFLRGPISTAEHLHHICPNKKCVNPDHLMILDPISHVMVGNSPPARNSRKTHCPRGHPYSGDNLRYYNGYRHCRACSLIQSRKQVLNKRASRISKT